MIKLLFSRQGAYFGFTIDNKVIKAIMGKYNLPYQPEDYEYVQKQQQMSRNKLPPWFVRLFAVTPEEQIQYDEAKDDEALCEIILADAKKENAKLISKTMGETK